MVSSPIRWRRFFDQGEVGEGEFELHGFDVAGGVDALGGVGDGVVVEGADDVDQGVEQAESVEESVGRRFAAAAQCAGEACAGEIDDVQGGGSGLARAVEVGESLESFVGRRHDAFVGVLVCAEAGGAVGAGEGVEESGLAGAFEADESYRWHAPIVAHLRDSVVPSLRAAGELGETGGKLCGGELHDAGGGAVGVAEGGGEEEDGVAGGLPADGGGGF